MSPACRDSLLCVEETMFCALSKQSLSHVPSRVAIKFASIMGSYDGYAGPSGRAV